MVADCSEPKAVLEAMSRVEQIDGCLKGIVDPKRPFAIDELNDSSADNAPFSI